MSIFTSTPPYELLRSSPFSGAETSELDRIFSGLWRLLQDQRLLVEFQDASLGGCKDTSISEGLPEDITDIVERYK
jgi:hypothetical protein